MRYLLAVLWSAVTFLMATGLTFAGIARLGLGETPVILLACVAGALAAALAVRLTFRFYRKVDAEVAESAQRPIYPVITHRPGRPR